MAKIVSGKRWVLSVWGDVPTNVDENVLLSVVMQQVALSLTVGSWARGSNLRITTESPEELMRRIGVQEMRDV
jgi:hypothetical protein